MLNSPATEKESSPLVTPFNAAAISHIHLTNSNKFISSIYWWQLNATVRSWSSGNSVLQTQTLFPKMLRNAKVGSIIHHFLLRLLVKARMHCLLAGVKKQQMLLPYNLYCFCTTCNSISNAKLFDLPLLSFKVTKNGRMQKFDGLKWKKYDLSKRTLLGGILQQPLAIT